MVVWQGITEGGTAVPVQVTEAGRVVAEGKEGPAGPPGPPGPEGPQGEYGPGDDVDLGSINATGAIKSESTFLSYRNATDTTFLTGYLNDDIKLTLNADGGINAAGNCVIGNPTSNSSKVLLNKNGSGSFQTAVRARGSVLELQDWQNTSSSNYLLSGQGNVLGAMTDTVTIATDGSATFALDKAGFTSDGEIFFTSRNERYRLVVSNSLVTAEPYTREIELREKAQKLREPRTQDIVPED